MKPSGLSIIMCGLIGALIWIWLAVAVLSHSFYSAACCSGHDCAPIPFSAVMETRDGFIVELQPGEHPIGIGIFFIPHGSPNIHQSQDGYYHACILPGGFDDGDAKPHLQCLYVPYSA